MNRSTILLALLLLAGVLSAQYVLQPGHPMASGPPHWPAHQAQFPPPQDIVNVSTVQVLIDELGGSATGTLGLTGGQAVTLVTVPADRWFLLTNLHITRWDYPGYLKIVEVAADSTITVRVEGTLEETMLGSMRWTPSPLVFSPGSQVVLQNVSSSGTIYYSEFMLSGHFVDG